MASPEHRGPAVVGVTSGGPSFRARYPDFSEDTEAHRRFAAWPQATRSYLNEAASSRVAFASRLASTPTATNVAPSER